MFQYQPFCKFLRMKTPYDHLGDAGIRRLVDAFYDAMDQLPDAAEIRAMHGSDLGPMRKALTTYFISWMGGPPVYPALKGSMCLTEAHSHFMIGPRARDQWLHCMDVALESIEPEVRAMLELPLRRVAEAVQNAQSDDHGDVRLIARG